MDRREFIKNVVLGLLATQVKGPSAFITEKHKYDGTIASYDGVRVVEFDPNAKYGNAVALSKFDDPSVELALKALQNDAKRVLPVGTKYQLRAMKYDLGTKYGIAWYYGKDLGDKLDDHRGLFIQNHVVTA